MDGADVGPPAHRIETPRLVIRCWRPEDAALLGAAIEASLEHLRPWMPWARDEPRGLTAQTALLRRFRREFDEGKDFVYGILDPGETEVLGGTGLHPRVGKDALEIGYWIRVGHTNRGLATEAAAALTRVAFEVSGTRRVEIHCDPANAPSAAVAAKLGFTHAATRQEGGGSAGEGPRDVMIWLLSAEDYPGTAAAEAELRAFDPAGAEVLDRLPDRA
jgi:RimJ/RimL family protein N-acetyltransferase